MCRRCFVIQLTILKASDRLHTILALWLIRLSSDQHRDLNAHFADVTEMLPPSLFSRKNAHPPLHPRFHTHENHGNEDN